MSLVMDPPSAHPALAALAALDEAAAGLTDTNLWSLSDAEVLELRAGIERVRSRLDAATLAATGELSARDVTARLHQVHTTTWLVNALRLHQRDAARELRLATALRTELPATAAALAQGSIGTAAAELIAGTDRALTATATAAQRSEAEALLAAQAAVLPVRDLQQVALHLRHRLDPDAGDRLAAEEEQQVAARELHLRLEPDGSARGRFTLDKEGAAILATALDPLAKPRPARDGVPDGRSAPGRRADALVELAQRALASGELPDSGGTPTQLSVTVDLATLRKQLGAAGADLDFGLPLSAEAARRLGCDTQLLPVLLGGAGQPLDVGRTTRTVPGPRCAGR